MVSQFLVFDGLFQSERLRQTKGPGRKTGTEGSLQLLYLSGSPNWAASGRSRLVQTVS